MLTKRSAVSLTRGRPGGKNVIKPRQFGGIELDVAGPNVGF
jgi:hypothetical protein